MIEQAVAAAPTEATYWNAKGVILRVMGRLPEAASCLHRALQYASELGGTWSNLGNVLKDQKHFQSSIRCHERAIALKPTDADILHNHGVALAAAQRYREAIQAFNRALIFKPGATDILWDRALSHLHLGDFAAGWLDYDARLVNGLLPIRKLPGQTWRRQRFADRHLLITAEQGFGDAIWAARFFPMVKALGGTITLECQPELIPLFETMGAIDRFVPKGAPLPSADWHCSICSLPGLFTPDPTSISGVAYLKADSDRVSRLTTILDPAGKKRRVGIVWWLGLAWSLDLPHEHSLEATPLAVDGILYFSGQSSVVYAVDAVKGTLLWKYDPEIWSPDPSQLRFIFSVNRGVAYWKGKLYVGTIDGRLIALDAKSGALVWSAMTIPSGSKRTITGQPRVFNGKVVIGNGGGDFGERGYVTAYDTETGKQVWRFYTVPGSPGENATDSAMTAAARTWDGNYWTGGTGGAVWSSVTYDPDLNLLYFGTGNAAPYKPSVRSPGNGANLYTASVVALDADTGRYVWHYQVNPRDAWDYDAVSDILLSTLTIHGELRRVLMVAPKNGFFYVIDRQSGKLLSADKLGRATWAERIDLETGLPVEAPNIRYDNGPVTIWPGIWGSHNWQAMAYSRDSGLVYIPYMQVGMRFSPSTNGTIGGTVMTPVIASSEDGKGKLLAWDPIARKARWSVPREHMWNGGTLVTAGNLVFQGIENGTLNAYDAANGRSVWSFDAKLGIIASPVSYAVHGVQYISVLVGYGGGNAPGSSFMKSGWKYGLQPRRLLTFALNGKALLPATPPPDFSVNAVDDEKLVIDDAAVAVGVDTFGAKACSMCHGADLVSAGSPAPDLRESKIALDESGLRAFLRSGALVRNGMPKFAELTDEQVHGLYMLIRAKARAVRTLATLGHERATSPPP